MRANKRSDTTHELLLRPTQAREPEPVRPRARSGCRRARRDARLCLVVAWSWRIWTISCRGKNLAQFSASLSCTSPPCDSGEKAGAR